MFIKCIHAHLKASNIYYKKSSWRITGNMASFKIDQIIIMKNKKKEGKKEQQQNLLLEK